MGEHLTGYSHGTKKLTDAELLAIILRTGTKEQNVVELSRKILRKFRNNLNDTTIKELKKISGLGNTKACQILSLIELAKRLIHEDSKPQLVAPKDVFRSVKEIRESKKEHLLAIYLDVKNREITREIVSIGTLTANLVHPREVFEPAVANTAAGIIIVHNHPSGDTEPSREDIKITKQLAEAGKILGIPIIDHVIVGKDTFYSFEEHNQLT